MSISTDTSNEVKMYLVIVIVSDERFCWAPSQFRSQAGSEWKHV